MGRDIWSCSHWRILLGRHASSSPWLPFILRLTLLILLSVLVCRSSSPSCSGVSGFHQSQRLRHSQLVSTTSRPVPRTNHVSLCLSFFFFFFLCLFCVWTDLRHGTIYCPSCLPFKASFIFTFSNSLSSLLSRRFSKLTSFSQKCIFIQLYFITCQGCSSIHPAEALL